MSDCKFSHLKFGEEVRLHGGSSCCGICGADTQMQTEKILWKYQGHSGDMDIFSAISLEYCPSCGHRIDGYGEVCGDAGGLNIATWINSPIEVYRGSNEE